MRKNLSEAEGRRIPLVSSISRDASLRSTEMSVAHRCIDTPKPSHYNRKLVLDAERFLKAQHSCQRRRNPTAQDHAIREGA